MICPQCKTENRDERTECYHCGQELSTLRMIVNRARNHYNEALEHAERGRDEEASRELRHALELDGSFVEAWLVLGTLHARAERLDEAREAWRTALAQDARFERGHNYLLKAEQIEPALPAMRRLRLAALGLGLLLILAVAFAVFQSRPDTGMDKIGDALTLRENNRWGEALERLEAAKSDPLAPRRTRRVAESLGDALAADLRGRLEKARWLADSGDFAGADGVMDGIESLAPPAWAAQELGATHDRLVAAMIEEARSRVARFRSGELPYEALQDELRGWLQIVEGSPDSSALHELLTETTEEHRRTLMARLRPEILALEDDVQAARRIDELAVQYPALKSDLEDILRSRLAVTSEARVNEFDRLVREGRLDAARERLLELRALYESLGRAAPADLIARMEAGMTRGEKSIALERLRRAFTEGDYEAVLELASAMEGLELTESESAEIDARRAEAERLLAAELWTWSQALDREFEMVTISLDDARLMLDHYNLIIRHAPRQESVYRTTRTLFRAAAAELRLGRAAEARALIQRLRADFPESSLLRYPSFVRFEERLAAALDQE
jgi:hypothetical protein